MAMSNYNRQNPFMYLLETKQSELIEKSTISVKNMIVMMILSAICIILNISYCIMYSNISMVLISFITVYLDLMTFIEIRSCVREIHERDVNELIFGDEYKDINLNNELLLSKINDYNVAIGKVTNANEMSFIYSLLYLVLISLNIIFIMIKIIN